MNLKALLLAAFLLPACGPDDPPDVNVSVTVSDPDASTPDAGSPAAPDGGQGDDDDCRCPNKHNRSCPVHGNHRKDKEKCRRSE